MIVIESNYKSLGRVFNLKSLANKERKINWGVRVNIDGEKIKIEDVINTNLSNISNMYESDKIRIIHELLGKYVMRLKKHNVKLIYQINLSQTYRTMKKNNEYDEYTQVIFTMILKGFIDNHCIISTAYSLPFNEIDINKIRVFCQTELFRAIVYKHFKIIDKNFYINKIVFSSFPAAIVNHEVFGHFFEEDNFSDINISRQRAICPPFISVYDKPEIKLSGYAKFDDVGKNIATIPIIQKGVVQNLIESNMLDSNSRSRAGFNKILSRVTNTIIKPEYLDDCNVHEGPRIIIESINHAMLKDSNIVIDIDSCFLQTKRNIYYIPTCTLKLNIFRYMKSIYSFHGNRVMFSTMECIKKGQRGGVGIESEGVLLDLDTKVNFNGLNMLT